MYELTAEQLCFHEIPGQGCIGNSQIPIFPMDLDVIYMCIVICRWWEMPLSSHGPVGQNGGHAVKVACGAHGLVQLSNADPLCGRWHLVTCAHCQNVCVGLCNDGLDLLKFNMAKGSTVIRDGGCVFCCAEKFNGEGFVDQVLCLDTIDNCIYYHADSFNEQ